MQAEVRDAALAAIDSGEDLERWINPADRRKRETVLKKTREQLLTPQPAAKRIPRPVLSETPFKDGDVIAYRHASGTLFGFWVSDTQTDKGGTYSHLELLEFAGAAVPPLKALTRLPRGPTEPASC